MKVVWFWLFSPPLFIVVAYFIGVLTDRLQISEDFQDDGTLKYVCVIWPILFCFSSHPAPPWTN